MNCQDTYTWYGEKLPAKKREGNLMQNRVLVYKGCIIVENQGGKVSCKCPPGHRMRNYVSRVSSTCPVHVPGINVKENTLCSLVIPFATHFWYG